MKKLSIIIIFCVLISGCGVYATTKYSVDLNAQQTNLSHMEDVKKASACSFLLLGFIPWPWHKHKTPDTLFEAMQEQGIQHIVWLDTTYDYKLTYANKCQNAYGY